VTALSHFIIFSTVLQIYLKLLVPSGTPVTVSFITFITDSSVLDIHHKDRSSASKSVFKSKRCQSITKVCNYNNIVSRVHSEKDNIYDFRRITRSVKDSSADFASLSGRRSNASIALSA